MRLERPLDASGVARDWHEDLAQWITQHDGARVVVETLCGDVFGHAKPVTLHGVHTDPVGRRVVVLEDELPGGRPFRIQLQLGEVRAIERTAP